MSYPVVFQLNEVADILELSKSTVKNWTIGRPLKIEPSLRSGHGAGASNLYGIADVQLMALAAQLNRDGFSTSVIEAALAKAKGKLNSSKALVISSPGRTLDVRLVHKSSTLPTERASEIGRYTLDTEKLLQYVQTRMEEMFYRKNVKEEDAE